MDSMAQHFVPPAPATPAELAITISTILGDLVKTISVAFGEVTLRVNAADYHAVAILLRDGKGCQFEQRHNRDRHHDRRLR